MQIKQLVESIARRFLYYPGWCTSRKIVVIESDDWGNVCIPSKEAYDELRSAGIRVDSDPYCKFDGLATPEDLKQLFEVLTSYKDRNGRHPVITANSVMANPDFAKIQASNFLEYHYERFTDTLKKNKQTASSFDLWEEGISKNIFLPQFHGREHLQIQDWLQSLQEGDKEVREAFRFGAFGIPVSGQSMGKRKDFRAAFDCNSEEELRVIKKIIEEGLDLFEEIFHYRSHSFIAPCYTWSRNVESTLSSSEVSLLQGIAFQKEPVLGQNRYKKRFNYLGKKNKWGQHYIVRNVFFEPTVIPAVDWVKRTLQRVKEAFDHNRPAIIGSHRVNFIGARYEANRDKNLQLLSAILDSILQQWPEVEFMSTAELGQIIEKNKN
jgi:hypothetical protein